VKKIGSIAWVTVRDALRQKLAVNLLLFALLLIIASITISELTFGEQYRIIADLTLTAASLFGTLIAVFLGAGLVAGDIQRKTVYPILAKPVSRAEYLIGRYLGLVATLTLNLLMMGVATVGVLALYRNGFGFLSTAPVVAAFSGLAIQLAMVGALSVLFSSFTNATLASIVTLGLVVAGQFSGAALPYWRERPVARALSLVIPDLPAVDFKVEVVYEELIAPGRLALSAGYGLLYAAFMVALACAIFARRDLR
jgi:ABC-type transport system involved in multi-copper enzyme maturation permease subunit